MVNMQIIPLFGSSFNVYAPLITAIVGFFTFFNVYARILKLTGIQEEDSIMGADFCHKMTPAEIEEIEAGKKLVAGQLRTLGHLLWVNDKNQGDSIELMTNIRRSDEESVDSSNNTRNSNNSDEIESKMTFRDRARVFSNLGKPGYVSLSGSSPGAELDTSNELPATPSSREEGEISIDDWNIPTTKRYGRYG